MISLLVGLFCFHSSYSLPFKNYNCRVTFRLNSVNSISNRVQRIKDISVTKEILNDLTSAEFALKVVVKSKRDKIDYDMLIGRLDDDIRLLETKHLSVDTGLLERVRNTKNELLQTSENKDSDSIPETSVEPALKAVNASLDSIPSIRFVVREDGTVDWEETIASSKEVAKFGTELWERLNGKQEEEGIPSISELFAPVPTKTPETEEIKRLTGLLQNSTFALEQLLTDRNSLKSDLRKARKSGNEISSDDLQGLRRLDLRVKEQEKRVKLLSLDRDMELICVTIEQELQQSISIADQRMILAQVSVIDRQLNNLLSGLKVQEIAGTTEGSTSDDGYLTSLVDDDELSIISLEVR